jgi:hypothetical protein
VQAHPNFQDLFAPIQVHSHLADRISESGSSTDPMNSIVFVTLSQIAKKNGRSTIISNLRIRGGLYLADRGIIRSGCCGSLRALFVDINERTMEDRVNPDGRGWLGDGIESGTLWVEGWCHPKL